jgi:dihydrofolate reductase
VRLNIVVAMSTNRVIGRGGELPWRLSGDLKYFMRITMAHPIIMGRKTHESIARALPGRLNVVITHQSDYAAPGCKIVDSLKHAMQACGSATEAMIIGGATLYQEALPMTQRIYLTEVHVELDGDTVFPALHEVDWCETSREFNRADDANEFDYSFVVLERTNG